MTSMTPAEQAAWDAIGHDQRHWGAVKRALAAAAPVIRREAEAAALSRSEGATR